MNTYTDLQLQVALSKMLPERLVIRYEDSPYTFVWADGPLALCTVQITEWLHICWLIEKTLNDDGFESMAKNLCDYFEEAYTEEQKKAMTDVQIGSLLYSASWQDRAIALCRVKKIEII